MIEAMVLEFSAEQLMQIGTRKMDRFIESQKGFKNREG